MNRWAVAKAITAPQWPVYPTILLGVAPSPYHKGSIMDKKFKKILNKIRKMSFHDKLILMDWLNAWYDDYKEQQELDQEQYYQMLEAEE